jgi:transglutaminase-like putative cysteine protease
MKIRRETREQAIYEGWNQQGPAVDIVALSAVPVDKPLANARSLTYLAAILSGGGVEVLLGHNEDAERPGEVIVRIPDRSQWKSYRIPMIDSRFADTLKATPLIQKDDPKIQRVAQSVIGDVTHADEAAALLNAWVHDRLHKEPVMGVPSALDVPATGKGDCNEHTTLFTALARSVGIPTRMAGGIVYSDQVTGNPAFYYHAWPEVYLGDWVPIDPTFGQFPADATHIKLVEGSLENQLSLVRVVGNLKIQILASH